MGDIDVTSRDVKRSSSKKYVCYLCDNANFLTFLRYDRYKPLLDRCIANKSDCFEKNSFSSCCVHDPPLYYFYREVLDVSSHIEDTGRMNGKLVGCLLLAWIVVCACIIKGVKSSGKVYVLIPAWNEILFFKDHFPKMIVKMKTIRKGMPS